MSLNSGDCYMLRIVRAMEEGTSDLESKGSVALCMRFLDASKYIFCWIKTLIMI